MARFFFLNSIKKNLLKDKAGFYLMFGLLVSAFLMFLFLIILESKDVYFQTFDLTLAKAFGSWRTPGMTAFMLLVTTLGSWAFVRYVVIIAALVMLRYRRLDYALALVVSSLFGEFLTAFVKNETQRIRPEVMSHLAVVDGFSFPSGHAMTAVCLYGMLSYFLFRLSRGQWAKIFWLFSGVLLILLIGLSRVYLGVHWATDILGSFTLGSAWITIIITLLEIRRR